MRNRVKRDVMKTKPFNPPPGRKSTGVYMYRVPNWDGTFRLVACRCEVERETDASYEIRLGEELVYPNRRKRGEKMWVRKKNVTLDAGVKVVEGEWWQDEI